MDGGGVQNASVRPRTSASSLSRPLINNAPPAIPRHTQRTHGLLHQQQPHQQQQQRHYQDNAPNLHGNYPRTPTPNHQAPLSHSSVPVSPTTHTNSPPASALEQALAAGRGVPVMCGHCTQLTYCLDYQLRSPTVCMCVYTTSCVHTGHIPPGQRCTGHVQSLHATHPLPGERMKDSCTQVPDWDASGRGESLSNGDLRNSPSALKQSDTLRRRVAFLSSQAVVCLVTVDMESAG
eukprot:scaffold36401_cov22-Tisochrysis_lutea.AAC.1